MSLIGYARVSTTDQDLAVQLDELEAAGCEKVFAEKRSGTTTASRDQLALALDYVRDGDVLVVSRLDRLARSIIDLRHIIDQLQAKGVGFRALNQSSIDTARPDGRLMLHMLAAFAEFETELRHERQMAGIAKAKAAGVYKGRKPTVDVEAVRSLHATGVGPAEIARRLGIGRASVYRALG